MTDSFIPMGSVAGKVVVDLAKRRQALRDSTAELERRSSLPLGQQIREQNAMAQLIREESAALSRLPLGQQLREATMALDPVEGRRLEIERGKALIMRGLKLMQDNSNVDVATNFLDEILAAREDRRVKE